MSRTADYMLAIEEQRMTDDGCPHAPETVGAWQVYSDYGAPRPAVLLIDACDGGAPVAVEPFAVLDGRVGFVNGEPCAVLTIAVRPVL